MATTKTQTLTLRLALEAKGHLRAAAARQQRGLANRLAVMIRCRVETADVSPSPRRERVPASTPAD